MEPLANRLRWTQTSPVLYDALMPRLCLLFGLLLAACPQDKDKDDDPDSTSDTAGSTIGSTAEDPSTGVTDTTGDDVDCAFLPGKSFRQDGGYECPLEPSKTCYDELRFTETTYDYYHSDYASYGEFTCEGGVISEASGGETMQVGTSAAATGKLVWKGKGFTAQQQ